MRRGFLGLSKEEPTDLRVSHKSTRLVSLDTLQAAIDTAKYQVLSDTYPVSIDTARGKTTKGEVLILETDKDGVLRDEEGRARNKEGQLIDAHGTAIPYANAVALNDGFERQRALRDYNSPEQLYAARSTICYSTLQRAGFELNPAYIFVVGQHPFHGLPHDDPIDHLESFEELETTIKCNGVSEDYYYCKLFPYSLSGEAACWFQKLPP